VAKFIVYPTQTFKVEVEAETEREAIDKVLGDFPNNVQDQWPAVDEWPDVERVKDIAP
jgi:hypothetical protein